MLVVTTTVRMVNRVHSHTTSTGPVVAFGLELVERAASLEEGLVDTSTTSDDADGRACRSRDSLFRAGRQSYAGLVVVGGVANNGGIVARCAGEDATVANLLLDVADDRTLRALGDGEDVADVESGLLAAVHETTGVHSLGGDEGLLAEFVAVRVAEDDAGEGSTTIPTISVNADFTSIPRTDQSRE